MTDLNDIANSVYLLKMRLDRMKKDKPKKYNLNTGSEDRKEVFNQVKQQGTHEPRYGGGHAGAGMARTFKPGGKRTIGRRQEGGHGSTEGKLNQGPSRTFTPGGKEKPKKPKSTGPIQSDAQTRAGKDEAARRIERERRTAGKPKVKPGPKAEEAALRSQLSHHSTQRHGEVKRRGTKVVGRGANQKIHPKDLPAKPDKDTKYFAASSQSEAPQIDSKYHGKFKSLDRDTRLALMRLERLEN